MRPAGTDTEPVGSPSKNGITFRNPCQWMVWASNRSGRSASPRLVSCIRNSVPSFTQNIGAECWALFFWAARWTSVRPVTLRNPKMYVLSPGGGRREGVRVEWEDRRRGRERDPSVGPCVEQVRRRIGRGREPEPGRRQRLPKESRDEACPGRGDEGGARALQEAPPVEQLAR